MLVSFITASDTKNASWSFGLVANFIGSNSELKSLNWSNVLSSITNSLSLIEMFSMYPTPLV